VLLEALRSYKGALVRTKINLEQNLIRIFLKTCQWGTTLNVSKCDAWYKFDKERKNRHCYSKKFSQLLFRSTLRSLQH
jgi:hypothetical protein